MPDDWDNYCPKTKADKDKLSVYMGFTVTPQLAEDIRRCVMRRGESLSAWLRIAAQVLVDVDEAECYEEPSAEPKPEGIDQDA